MQVGFDDQFRDAMEEFGGGTDLVGELEADAPGEGWEVERFEDGDIEGVVMTKEFSSLEELEELVEEGRLSGPQEGLVGAVSFTDTGDTIRFEAEVPEGSDFEGIDPAEMEGLFTYDARIRVTFPGEVIEHNGELEENTVTWSFDDPTSMAGAALFAEARKGSGSPVVAIVGVLLGLWRGSAGRLAGAVPPDAAVGWAHHATTGASHRTDPRGAGSTQHRVGVAPAPGLPGFDASNDRVTVHSIMHRSVTSGRRVATGHFPARETQAQMNPAGSLAKAVLASSGIARRNRDGRGCQVFTACLA